MTKRITLPITDEAIQDLKAGDSVLLTGTILTGRDAAHKRLYELLEQGRELPVDLKGELIYYVGPAPAKPGYAVGPAGPTSSYRMDKYAPALMDLGWRVGVVWECSITGSNHKQKLENIASEIALWLEEQLGVPYIEW